ncbi:S8 family serine peptidase [Caloramator sp. E03]|uniref:S8 family serine peptidase n=1 Tax=Caloramator sp. E03 TaxID=2576307 RepID=UPI00143DD73B|nr:S8 family serine peptidase [Caloramator sp. E03]
MPKPKFKIISILVVVMLIFSLVSSSANGASLGKSAEQSTKYNTSKKLNYTKAIEQLKVSYKKLLQNNSGNQEKNTKDKFNDNITYSAYKQSIKKESADDTVRVIVQLEEKSLKDYAEGKPLKVLASNSVLKSKVLNSQAQYKKEILKINKNVKFRQTYYGLINGFSMIAKRSDVDKIRQIPGVKHIEIAKEYYVDMNYANYITNVPDVWQNSDYGYKGEGLVVAVIDSGIDVNHKDMKIITDTSKVKYNKDTIERLIGNNNLKGKYYNIKVPYAYNYADDNNDVIDKNSLTGMHGMHVSGIIAANGLDSEVEEKKAIKGVAPEAQLFMMKVFSNNPNFGSAFDDDIVKAIDDAVLLDADVINMSLGSPAGFQNADDAMQVAIKEATDLGTVVVASAGNEQYSTAPYKIPGVNDTSVIGTPGIAKDALQVASYENTDVTGYALEYEVKDKKMGDIIYTTSEIDPVTKLTNSLGYEIVDCGVGSEEDFQGKDLNGKIALIQRGGGLYFYQKKLNAQSAGAIGAIMYGYDGDDSYINMAPWPGVKIPAVFIKNSNGVLLKSLINDGLKVKFVKDNIVSEPNAIAYDMSDFTSWGPAPNLEFKPEVTAPGGNIWSTVNNNKYENMSGTSMASPHAAGIMALVLQHVKNLENKGNLKFASDRERVEFAKTLIINTAIPQKDPLSNLPFSPRRQGAGLVNAYAAVKNKVTATVYGKPTAALKEISGTKTFTITLKNYGDNDVTYDVSCYPEENEVLTEQPGFLETMSYETVISGAQVTFDKTSVTVPKGKQATVNVTINIPENTERNIFAEGFIRFIPKEDNVSTIGVPFMGFYGKWDEPYIVDRPFWDRNTQIGYTGLALGFFENGEPYYAGYDWDGSFDENNIAISTAYYSLGLYYVIPVATYLRNAKVNYVNVIDDDGKTITTLNTDNEVTKSIFAEGQWFNVYSLWDGYVYNASLRRFMPVKDGQYYIQIKSKIDYPDANYQIINMPVKVDSTEPVAEIISDDTASPGSYDLKIKAYDGLSGVQGFAIAVNGKFVTVDEYENPVFKKVGMDENGDYCYTLNLPGGIDYVEVFTIDYAGNYSYVTKQINASQLNITNPASGSELESGDFTLTYTYPEELLNDVSKFEIVVDGCDPYNNGKNLLYEVKGLQPGLHWIEVDAYDNDYNLIDFNYVEFNVKPSEFNFSFDNFDTGNIYSYKDLTVTGRVTTKPKTFKIMGNPVTINSDLTFSVKLSLKEGLNKVSIFAEDYNGEYFDYSYNIYCDTTAPEITLLVPKSTKDNTSVFVSEDAKSYKIEGTVKDNLFGYRLYVNESEIENVFLPVPDGNKTERAFSTDIELKDEVTMVEIVASDVVGNHTVKKIIITKENDRSPKITINQPLAKKGETLATIVGKKVTVSGKVENVVKGSVKIFINGEVMEVKANSTSCSFTKTITFDSLGDKTIDVIAVDSYGSQTSTKIPVKLIEKTPPKIKLIEPSANSTNITQAYDSRNYSIKFNVEDESEIKNINATLIIGKEQTKLDYETVSDGYVLQIPISENIKQYKVLISATDVYDNTGSATVTINKVIDKKGPVITMINPKQTSSTTTSDTLTLKFKAADDWMLGSVSIKVKYSDNSEEMINDIQLNSQKTIEVARDIKLSIGLNVITIIAEDNVGNKTIKEIKITRK